MRIDTMLMKALGLVMVATACGGGGGEVDPDARPDAEAPPDAAAPDAYVSPCKKVDLLFVIDASTTMSEEIKAMSDDVFPRFAEALRSIGDGLEDYRVAVLDACPSPANFHTRGKRTEACEFESGEVWMDSYSSRLNDEFACVADIYKADIATYPDGCTGDNDDEQPIRSAITALTPPYSDGPNAGFLRDDALLVIVAITDEDEHPVGGGVTAQQLYDELVAIKGTPHNMVFLGIGGESLCWDTPGYYGRATEAKLLKAVTNKFKEQERGVFWDLCTGRLENGLTEAMGVIEATCNVVD